MMDYKSQQLSWLLHISYHLKTPASYIPHIFVAFDDPGQTMFCVGWRAWCRARAGGTPVEGDGAGPFVNHAGAVVEGHQDLGEWRVSGGD